MSSGERQPISPRARALAQFANLDLSQVVIEASGPEGRIIERDIRRTLSQQPRLTRAASAQEAPALPDEGTGLGGRITRADLDALQKIALPAKPAADEELPPIPMRGTRKVIAERMLASLQTTAQLTLNAWADARALLSLRARLKASPEGLGLRQVTINDLILFTVSRVLPDFLALNAHLRPDAIQPYARVHLGLAVDTPRGLLVPVIRDAHALSLRRLAQEAGRLAESASGGKIDPADLEGGTFTVTNLGSLGVEHFTPVLNPPQVAILGVGAVALRPVGPLDGSATEHLPHLPLSLTVDHQAVDGAPAARFLQALSQALAQVDLLMAL
jgi:pyruvate dehydrogenase E2 component (dihydrolipoamide acetyltransferase)